MEAREELNAMRMAAAELRCAPCNVDGMVSMGGASVQYARRPQATPFGLH